MKSILTIWWLLFIAGFLLSCWLGYHDTTILTGIGMFGFAFSMKYMDKKENDL